MSVALRYIGRKPRGQRNLRHPVSGQVHSFFTERKYPATVVDDEWATTLLFMQDKGGRPLFSSEEPLAEPSPVSKTVRCKQCDATFTNQGLFLAHVRKEHKAQ